tara:strand:- start:656 stop:985 length:330 start_codon:yes stop_codon:yes gene_type:complete
MTQYTDRRQQRIDRAIAKSNQSEWVKHTINLRKGTSLNQRMEECGNKSHLVREAFKRLKACKIELDDLREENTHLRQNIAKLQARLFEEDEDRVIMHPGQTKFEVEGEE